jgi:Protein of unknown function (DUF1572)
MKTTTNYILSATNIFKTYKELAEKAMAQISDEQLFRQPDAESNSVYLIVKHLHGNMLSRWTDFLTTDGEKEWRNRDVEFVDDVSTSLNMTKDDVMKFWEEGWKCLFDALTQLSENDLGKIVKIRSEEHSVMEAINRQVAHYSSHIGQIIFIAKMLKSDEWNSLSIPKNKSKEFNDKMMK